MKRHPGNEVLERYSLANLSEPELERVEEHLLVCETCQDELAEIETFIGDMKYACAHVKPAPKKSWRSIFAGWWTAVPRPALAGAFAALLLVLGIPLTRHQAPAGPAVSVEMAAMRGATGIARAEANRPLHLKMDASLIEGAPAYRVEVVDAGGSSVWTGPARISGTTLTADVQKPLASGNYWIRVFASGADPIREYGLDLK
jgi:hypothetical protein